MRTALLSRLPDHCHLFTDVFRVFGHDGNKVLQSFMKKGTVEERVNLALEWQCLESMWCEKHQSFCVLFTGAASRVGGFPCVDFSTAGNKAGIEGRAYLAMLAFAARARAARNAVVGIENVVSCPADCVSEALGNEFTMVINSCVEPTDVGCDFISAYLLLFLFLDVNWSAALPLFCCCKCFFECNEQAQHGGVQ